jgi:transposase-like protein
MSFIDAHDFPAGLVLRVLGIAASTYYDWRIRQVSRQLTAFRSRRLDAGRYTFVWVDAPMVKGREDGRLPRLVPHQACR